MASTVFMKTAIKKTTLALLAILFALQWVPIRGQNPHVTGEPPMPPEVRKILSRSCFDCHSNQTVWPWYSRVAPLSWWIVRHVEEGREHLNFSTWNTLDSEKQNEMGEEIVEEIEKAKMPLPSYLVGHPDARLSKDDRQALTAWAQSLRTANPGETDEGKERD